MAEKKEDLFFLFQRPRKWNAIDKTWMGYERKRGKLSDLNGLAPGQFKRLLLICFGRPGYSFANKICHHAGLRHSTAAGSSMEKIVGLPMAHPLNRAVYSEF